jgi:hypothetical protein
VKYLRRRRFLRATKPAGMRTWKLWRRGIAGSPVGGGGRQELGYQGDDGGAGEDVGGGSPRKSPLGWRHDGDEAALKGRGGEG